MKLTRIVSISRPRFWIYELGPFLVGVAAAAQSDYSVWLLPAVMCFGLFFLYPANIYIYGINDIFDYETDRLNPKKVAYENLVMPTEHAALAKHILLVSTPFVLYGFTVLDFPTLVTLIAFFFFAGFYSAPPIRAKARAFLDSFFSGAHYVATGVFAYLLVSSLTEASVHQEALLVLTLAGLAWSVAMHAYSAVPDIAADAAAGLQTIATTLGSAPTIIACAVLYVGAALLSYPYLGFVSLLLGAVYVLFMLLSLTLTDQKLFRLYTVFPYVNTISGALIFFTVWFSL